MTDLSDRAKKLAQQARSAQDARGATKHEPHADPQPDQSQQEFRADRWVVWRADGVVVDVFFDPPCTRKEVRAHFYPDAKSILTPDTAR